MVLLDTNVLSELTRAEPDAKVLRYVAGLREAWLSVITLHELRYGLERLPEGKRRTALALAVEELLRRQEDRLIAVDPSIALTASRLRAQAAKQGRPLHLADALIASTAVTRGLALVTRNTGDFEGLDLELVNPWS